MERHGQQGSRRLENFHKLQKFQLAATTLPFATPAKQNTKNYENVHKRIRKCNQN